MRFSLACFLIACSAATWNDTFTATGVRSSEDAGAPSPDSGTSTQACAGLAASAAAPALTVTFPNHGAPDESIHVVSGAKTCDLHVDTDTDGVAFVSDASPCASVVAVGAPGQSTATVSGASSPTLLLFQWSYSSTCAIDDSYALEKK